MSESQFKVWKERIAGAVGLRTPQENRFYDLVAAELQNRVMKAGLWTRAYAESNGDEAKARAIYIRWRVAQLIEEEQERQKEAEAAAIAEQERREAAERARNEARWAAEAEVRRVQREKEGMHIGWILGIFGFVFLVIMFAWGIAASRQSSLPVVETTARSGNNPSGDLVQTSNPKASATSETTETQPPSEMAETMPAEKKPPVGLVFHNGTTPRGEPVFEVYDLRSVPVTSAVTRVAGKLRNGMAQKFSGVIVTFVAFDKEGKEICRQSMEFVSLVAGDVRSFDVEAEVQLDKIASHRFELESAQ